MQVVEVVEPQPPDDEAHVHWLLLTTRLPTTPPTLHHATRWIAQLGGFMGRKADGDPAVNVLWRRWSRLQDIVQTWSLTHPLHDVGNV